MSKLSKEQISMAKQEQEWQAQDDARTLRRAAEIRLDSARHSRAQASVKKELAALQTIVASAKTAPKPKARAATTKSRTSAATGARNRKK